MTDLSPRIARATFRRVAPEVVAALVAIDEAAKKAGLDAALLELVKIRASQMNGCAFCVQFHLASARTLQVAREKLDLLVAWQDAPVFTDRERAALAWTEALTDVALGVSDDDYEEAAEVFTEAQLAHLSAAIAAINSWNRIAVGFRFAPELPGPKAVET